MKSNRIALVALLLALGVADLAEAKRPPSRMTERTPPAKGLIPPATPLMACDPYFCVWSCDDLLTGDTPRHWTGKEHSLAGLIRIDGQPFRIMGVEPTDVPALPQKSLEVLPTRTVYQFAGSGVELTLTFLTPALPEDLEILSRPVTYVSWDVRATDGKPHVVSVYFDASSALVVNLPEQQVVWSTEKTGDLAAVKMGSKDQPVLAKRGDDLRIDWGYLYTAAPRAQGTSWTVAAAAACRKAFAAQGKLPAEADKRMPRAVEDDTPVAAFAFDLGAVSSRPLGRWLMLAYDDLYAIQYFKQNLRPFWRRKGMDAAGLLTVSASQREALDARCRKLDEELMADLTRAGGANYARICALAYRQTFAGNKIAADANGQPLVFPKENFSNGCIATVDVIYPMAPAFLLFSPSLTKAMLVSNLDYAASPRWKFPFAPHDLGTYPLANGQVYGGGERTEDRQMPVEESGNMLILVAALAELEGDANFAAQYWPVLTKWAEYLKEKGFNPENQLCTDDFAGHLAHNVNLSAKAIVALGAYARLCSMQGDSARAAEYNKLTKEFAARWVKEADDGDHFRLAFDKSGSWSQKYNLVWDRILGLNLFPDSVLRKELDYYKKMQKDYGLPLDNRKDYTKLDWTLWTASLTGDRADFDALVDPLHKFLNATPNRVPMTDWFWTTDAKMVGFQARPVVGGLFLKLLYDPAMWRKWASRDVTKSSNWAPLPTPPITQVIVPTADEQAAVWRYTTKKPTEKWFAVGFDDSAWKQGPAGFGSKGTPRSVVRTEWKTPDIWIRREITLPELDGKAVLLRIHHDEDAEVYLNGVLAASLAGFTTAYDEAPIADAARATLRAGKNTIAIHCRQTTGGQYIDAGLLQLVPVKK